MVHVGAQARRVGYAQASDMIMTSKTQVTHHGMLDPH